MKRRTTCSAIFFLMAVTVLWVAGSCDRRPGEAGSGPRDGLVGTWHLASLEEPAADGTLRRADASGSLVFARDGHMSVQHR